MVDATVIRYHREAYDQILTDMDPSARQAAEGTLGGLRFVRNGMRYHADPADFVQPRRAEGGDYLPVADWAWTPVPAPAGGLAPQASEWEMSRYRQYRSWLAGHRVGETVAAAVAFLSLLPVIGDQAATSGLPD